MQISQSLIVVSGIIVLMASTGQAQQSSQRGLLTAGPDGQAYYIQNSALWRWDPDAESAAVELADYDELAAALGISSGEVQVADLAVNSESAVWLSLVGRGELLTVDDGGAVTIAVESNDIIAVTGETSAQPGAMVIDASDAVFVADAVSGNILRITEGAGGFNVTVYTAGSAIETLLRSIVLAQTSGPFAPTALIKINDSSLYADGYYITQFSNSGSIDGDGAITRIVPNESHPDQAVWEKIFDPDLADPDIAQAAFHPTALALAGEANVGFDGKLFMANFGASMGPDMDGKVFVVAADGTLTEFVTEYVDDVGAPVEFGGTPVTGFYDTIDIAFSPGGDSAYGNYLYILSENGEGSGGGGKLSDIWRIDATGSAELFVEDVADSIGSLTFDTTGTFDNDLLVGTWATAEIYRVDSNGVVSAFHQIENSFILDMAVTEIDSIFAGDLLLTVTNNAGGGTQIISIDPDGVETLWAGNLDGGAIPGVDFVLDSANTLTLLYEGDSGLKRFALGDLLTVTHHHLHLRPTDDAPALYTLLATDNLPRLVRLAQTQSADDLTIETGSDIFSPFMADDNNDGYLPITFDEQGELYLFSQPDSAIVRGVRDDENEIFASFSTFQTAVVIDNAFNSENTELTDLVWTAKDHLLAQANNEEVASLSSIFTITSAQSPLILPAEGGGEISLTLTGSGQAKLLATPIDTDNTVSQLLRLTLEGASLTTHVAMDATAPANTMLHLRELSFDGSLRTLTFPGVVESIVNESTLPTFVFDTVLGDANDIVTPNTRYFNVQADNLGGDDADVQHVFSAAGLMTLDVAGDVRNMTFLGSSSTNFYRSVHIGGVVQNTGFFGGGMQEFIVDNEDNEDIAFDESGLIMAYSLGQVTVSQGDVYNSTFYSTGGVRSVELYTGSMLGAYVDGGRYVGRVYTFGDMDNSTYIYAINTGGIIMDVCTGGDCDAVINGQRVFRVRAGYTRDGQRRGENEGFSGGDFLGGISASYGLGDVNATGKIINASISCSSGIVTNIIAEDGLENTTISAPLRIQRILVGYLNGNRNFIVNTDANVSGNINTRYLGRMYYTGELDENLNLPDWHGPIHDDNP
ncbi:MAG: hypothetical protein JW709_06270 [Sedimentisphaerales bacterium]|nr:hypothetical protein [Sedimentisphaerales bacterium]